ncbi:unannotated protein [freshwater metagenome]|uniref:Unannotated protein n=1 Tax=freshwater metagenome TaxID=449393 RepID=A0A6J6DLX5_9ZZZZ
MNVRFRPVLMLAELALALNIVILASVTLDLDWVRSRAAGGQFEEFPLVIRILYLATAIGTLFLMRFLWRLQSDATVRQRNVAKWLGLLFLLSTFTQLISRSPNERFNAIPAVIIAFAFFRASRIR